MNCYAARVGFKLIGKTPLIAGRSLKSACEINPASHVPQLNLWVGKNQSRPKQYEGCSAEHVQCVLVGSISIVVRIREFHGHGSLLSLQLLIVQPASSPFRILLAQNFANREFC
jgi:hypothetical protein